MSFKKEVKRKKENEMKSHLMNLLKFISDLLKKVFLSISTIVFNKKGYFLFRKSYRFVRGKENHFPASFLKLLLSNNM